MTGSVKRVTTRVVSREVGAGAAAWDQMITNFLGVDFPCFATIGNHDCLAARPGSSGPGDWPDYQARL